MKGKLNFAAGLVIGAVLFGGGTALAASGIMAQPSANPIYVNGKQVQMEAYRINGNNYVKLRDMGEAVGFNVYWADGVQVDSNAPYTGVAPSAAIDTPETKPSPTEAAATVDVETAKDEIIRLTNDLRRENGVAELRKDDLLMQAAQVRAEEMAATGTYSHTRPNGENFNSVTDAVYMAENIHCISKLYLEQQHKELANAAVMLWSNSAVHLKNMKNPDLSSIGIGVATGIDENGLACYYCVQLFIYNGYTATWVDKPAL